MTPFESHILPVDLSVPDNRDLIRGRPAWVEALWLLCGARLLSASWILSSSFRCILLRAFGARIGEHVYLKPGIKVKFPWYLEIGDYSWIGEHVWIDNLSQVTIGSHACVSQGAYFCTGNHDWRSRNMRLFRKPIVVEAGAWVGAHSVLAPGVRVGRCAISSLGSVVMKSIPAFEVHAGNPAAFVKQRSFKDTGK